MSHSDGMRTANLISYLEKSGKIARIKVGRTHKLLLPEAADAPKPLPKRTVKSHRTDQNPPRLREVDISSLSYVPLPRAPLRWEEAQADS